MSGQSENRAVSLFAGLIFLLAAAGPLFELQRAATTPDRPDPVATYVARLSGHVGLREAIREYEAIGYIAEEEIDIRVGGPAQARYYLAQFALAPVLLDLDHEAYPVRLLNFARPEAIDPYLNRHRLRRLVEVDDHVVLVGPRERR